MNFNKTRKTNFWQLPLVYSIHTSISISFKECSISCHVWGCKRHITYSSNQVCNSLHKTCQPIRSVECLCSVERCCSRPQTVRSLLMIRVGKIFLVLWNTRISFRIRVYKHHAGKDFHTLFCSHMLLISVPAIYWTIMSLLYPFGYWVSIAA